MFKFGLGVVFLLMIAATIGCKSHATTTFQLQDSIVNDARTHSFDSNSRSLIGKHPVLHRGPGDILAGDSK
jgi:hypothetical protein